VTCPRFPAARPDSCGRIDEKELSYLVVGQLPDRHAEPKNGVLQFFCPEHRLLLDTGYAAQFADVIAAGETADVGIREQHTAATRHVFRRHVEKMAKRRPYPPHE
jgi:hypothetical protein